MSEADLADDLKASIQDAAKVFTAAGDADFKRHLATAALDFGRKRRRTLVGSITLVGDEAEYPAPADFLAFKSHLWGITPIARAKPWDKTWPGRLPDVRYVEKSDGTKKLALEPPPITSQISALGSEFRFYYYAAHSVNATAASTTILPGDRGLLLLRAQAEAMKEMAMRNLMKPVMVREGMSSSPKNGTPSYLYEKFMTEFAEAA
jgi:hypothetical protein